MPALKDIIRQQWDRRITFRPSNRQIEQPPICARQIPLRDKAQLTERRVETLTALLRHAPRPIDGFGLAMTLADQQRDQGREWIGSVPLDHITCGVPAQPRPPLHSYQAFRNPLIQLREAPGGEQVSVG